MIAETLNGRAPGFYITDEDTTNSYDETPPDIHFTRGRLDQVDYQTGLKTPGLTRGDRTSHALDKLLLGTAPDRVQTAHPSQQLQMSVFNAAPTGAKTAPS